MTSSTAPRKFLPAWLHESHPIVQREMQYWRRAAAWRIVRPAFWILTALAVGLAAGLAVMLGVLELLAQQDMTVILPSVGGLFVFVCAVAATMANLFLTLLANVFAATLVARERETLVWPSLRLTSLTNLEILGGKFTAYVYTLADMVFLIVALRLLCVAALGFTVAGWLMIISVTQWQSLPDMLLQLLFPLSMLGNFTWLVSWPFESVWSVLYNGALGLCLSTFTRTRRMAVLAVFGTHLILQLVYGITQQVLGVILMMAIALPTFFLMGLVAEETLGLIVTGSIYVLIPVIAALFMLLLQSLVIVVAFGVAYFRVSRLND